MPKNIISDALQVESQLSGQQPIPKGNLSWVALLKFALSKDTTDYKVNTLNLYPQVIDWT